MKSRRSKVLSKIMAVVLSAAMVMSNVTVYATGSLDVEQTEVTAEVSTQEVTTQEVTTEENTTSEATTDAGSVEETTTVEATAVEEVVDAIGVKSISKEAVFNVSDEINGTYTCDFVDKTGYFVVKATEDKSVVIDDNSKGSFTKRMKTGGTGSLVARSLQFTTTDKASIELSIMSSSSSAARVVLILDKEGKVVKELNLDATKDIVVLKATLEEAGTYYVASKEGGINFYGVTVKVAGSDASETDEEDKDIASDVTVEGDIYVTADGTGKGTKEDPADFAKAVEALEAGHTIHMAAGTYKYKDMIVIKEENSGTADAMKNIVADGEVVIDFSGMGYTGSEADKSNRGIALCGSYWNIKGVTITGAADNGMILAGHHNVLEQCVFAANHDSGLQVSRFNTKYDNIKDWPSYNLIKNCSAYDNCDISGENADGFAAKLTCGEGNVFDGCLSYNNSDDGWDLYAKTATGKIGVVTLKNCIAFRNGKLRSGEGSAQGDMNGFKLGSSQGESTSTPHVVINCIAFENGAHGFTDNGNESGIKLINCTSFNNSVYSGNKCANFQMNREKGGVNANLLSFSTSGIATDGFIGTVEDSVYYNSGKYYHITDKTAFAGKEKLGDIVTVSASDFASVTAPAATTDFHKEWRNADGSLNIGNFLQVKSSSSLAKLASDGGKLGSRLADGVYMDKAPSVSDKPVVEPTTEEVSTEEVTTVEPTTEETTTEETTTEEATTQEPTTEVDVLDGDVVDHNFEEKGLESEVFTFVGNMSDSKGTVSFNGMTLKKCLKMETATSIKFTAKEAAKLVMVFNDGESRKIKVDGEKLVIDNGMLVVEVSEGDHEITKGDSVNLYYIALVYPKAEEVEPELPSLPKVEPVESVSGKIDVWDLGAATLDPEKYTNKLTEDIINSWYTDVTAGTTGKNLASFQVNDKDGNVVFAFNDGGYPATHRLRSTNTALTRYDDKSLKNEAGEVTYTGYIYSNKAKTDTVNVQIALTAGDKVTLAVASNGTDSEVVFRAPNGEENSMVHTLGSSTASLMNFIAKETGLYTIYSATEKLCLARIYVEHTQPINVVGRVNAPASLDHDYSVVFENVESGVKTTAKVENGTYKAVLNEGFNYRASLADANGYIITSQADLNLIKENGGEDHYLQFDIEVGAVSLVTVKGELAGLSDAAIISLQISFDSEEIYVPEIKKEGTGYTAVVETGVEYTINVSNIDDYELGEVKTIKATEDSTVDIEFVAKPVYNVTIAPQGATLADLAEAEFVFTRHSDEDVTAEEKYVYTFTGTDNIKLRDGVYTVKVNGLVDYKQKLTSNLKVDGADVTKTIGFEFTGDPTLPKTWDFTGSEYIGQSSYNGLEIVGGSKHSNSYGMMIKNGSIEVPVKGASTIKLEVGYTWDLTDGETNHLQTTDGGFTTIEFKYNGAARKVTIAAGIQATSYIRSITVVPVSGAEEVVATSWDFRTEAYTGQSSFNGLDINGGRKHGSSYGMMINNGSVKVPVTGPCTIKVSVGYNWDITIDGFQGERYKDNTNTGDITLEYAYTGKAGVVEVVAGSEFTSYIKAIETVYETSADVESKTITVGATGCDYTTINDALAAVRKMNREPGQRVIIEIQPGDYEEMLVIDVKDVTLKNASDTPSIETKNKGVDIDDNAVRITSYYGHGYTYYSMDKNCKYNEEILQVNKENGYPSFVNPGSGTTNGSYWNATVVVSADGFEADGIIFENSFNQYVSKKAANDVIVAQSSAKEGSVKRADMKAGDTTVQNKKYVERAAALALYNNVKNANFDNCKFIGRQDTLYGGTNTTAAFYKCAIYGGTDYIFGGMTAVFAKCALVFNTMEDGNDVGYITAAQQKSGRGYLMYNCHVTSTVPGVDTASEKISKPGYLGRPWEANTSEVVYYATVIDAEEDGTSMITPAGWNSSLSSTSDNVYEFGSFEMAAGVDNTAKRAAWSKTYATIDNATLADGTPVSVAAFLGDWDAFAGKDMDVVYPDGKVDPAPVDPVDPTPSTTTEFVLESSTLDAFAAGAKADGEEFKAGTEDYFTIICSAKTKIDASNKTFDDGYASAQRINLGGKALVEKNSVKFTTSNPATVKIWWAEGGDDNRQMAILNTAGEIVTQTNETVAKNATCISTLELTEAGTYYLGGDINNNYIFKVLVTEEAPVVAEPFTMTFESSALEAVAQGAKADGEELSAGTDNYFTVIFSAKSKVDASNKTFEDGYASGQRLNLGGKVTLEKNAVKFTTSNPSSVKIWWVEGGDDNRQIAILNAAGEQVAVTLDTVAKNATCISTLELAQAGTYFLGGDINNNYIYKIEVTETPSGNVKPERAAWDTVAAPEITNVVVNADSVDVTVKAVIGYDGADEVVVTMTDVNGKETSKKSSKEGKEVTINFVPTASGTYTFEAKAVRKDEADKTAAETKTAEFVLPLSTPVLVSATSIGNGSIEVVWNEVKEAQKYLVYVQKTSGIIARVVAFFTDGEPIETEDTTLVVEGLKIGETYKVTVKAVRGNDESAVSEALEVTITEDAQRAWAFAAYGSSTDTKNNGNIVDKENGKVTVYSEGGKGKIVPGSTDGLAYYYTKIDPETENFTFTADIHVNNWTLSNGQEGFGIMVTDTVGQHGDGTAFWNNGYQAIASKVEYYHDGTDVTTDSTASKITMKLGMGVTAKLGVTAKDVADIKSGAITMPAGFTTETKTLETSCASQGAGTYNIMGNYVGVEPTGNQANLITDYKLSIQRNNTGYIITYMDMDGNVLGSQKYYDLERTALTQIDPENIYVGIFASRNARITASNIVLTTIDPKDDAPAEEREVVKVVPQYSVTSATTSNTADYDLVFRANAEGTLVVSGAVEYNNKVEANKDIIIPSTLVYGNNKFDVTFTPDEKYVPGEYMVMENYDTVIFSHTVLYKNYGSEGDSLYVAPNGSMEGNGTKANPIDIYTAVKYAMPGQTIVLTEGTYKLTRTVKVERGTNGTADKMIQMVADPEAKTRPVLDFQGRCAGMVLAGNYWYFKGFDVTRSADGQKGVQVSGNNNVLDQINAYMNGNTGIQISRYLGTDEFDMWPANNTILNCTSYLNADKGYEDADGFAAKLTVGNGNVFDGCIAHHNADDGWDLFAKVQSGSIGVVTIKNCVAYKNGYVLTVDGKKYSALDFNGIETDAGNGNGFKMGGDSMPGAHEIHNSIAFENKAKGIDSNSCPDIKVYNCVTFNNESYNVAFYTNTAVNTDFYAEGLISYRTQYKNVAEQQKLLGTQDKNKVYGEKNFYWTPAEGKSLNTSNAAVADDWFESLTFAGIDRNADGTINTHGFLVLTDKALAGGSIGGSSSDDLTIGGETDGTVADGSQTEKSEELIKAEKELQNALEELEAVMANVAVKEEAVAKAQAELDVANAEFAAAKESYLVARGDLDEEKEAKKLAVKNLEAAKAQRAALEDKLAELEEALIATEDADEKNEIQNNIDETKKAIVEAKANVTAATKELNAVEKRIASATKVLEAEKVVYTAARLNVQPYESALKDAKTALRIAKDKIPSAQKKVDKATIKVENALSKKED